MPATLLDGKALAQTIQAELAAEVAAHVAAGGRPPGLAAVRVGDDPGSESYVRGKIRACEKNGFAGRHIHLPATTTQAELLDVVARLNTDPAVHGILVQLPLPKQIDEDAVKAAVVPHKDVDGFHPENVGLLAGGNPRFVSCTPLGIQQLLVRNGIETAGKHVVIVGRSNIVGKPLALLLMQKGRGADATVTVAHSRTRDLAGVTRTADILVAAIGRPRLVTADMVKPGATVIDVGINQVPGEKLKVGDVDFAAVQSVAAAITPVPGGVGPMTITMLLHNTWRAARP